MKTIIKNIITKYKLYRIKRAKKKIRADLRYSGNAEIKFLLVRL
jgi:hypothetical protein